MKSLTKHLDESLRIGINDTPELNIEDIHTVYRIDLCDWKMFLDIHEVNNLQNQEGIVRVIGNNKFCKSLMYDGGNIPGNYKLVEEDGYMYEKHNKNSIRLLLFPNNKDKFYKVFNFIYSKGQGAKITIDNIRGILDIESIMNIISSYGYSELMVQTPQDILDNINKYSQSDK